MQKKNNLKSCFKIFAGIMFALGIMTTSVFSAAPTAEINGNTITVDYTETGAGFGTFIYVFDTVVDIDTVIDQELIDRNLVWTGVASEGSAVIELPEGSEYGAYTILLGAKGMASDKADRCIYVIKLEPGIEAAALEAIITAGSEDEMINEIKKYNHKAFIVDAENIETQKDFIFDVVSGLGTSATIQELTVAVESVSRISAIREVDEKEIARILVENKIGLGLTDDIDKYCDVVAGAVSERIDINSSVADIKQIVNEELALAALNGVGASSIIETIEKYNEIFNVRFSNKLKEVSEYEVEKVLDNIDFDDITMVEIIVNDAIDDVYAEQKKKDDDKVTGGGGSSGGGGGGGGGGSNRGYSAITSLEQPEVKEINGDEDKASVISDIAGYEWAEESIEYLCENSIMTGDGDGKFRPGDRLTREEFVKLVICSIGGGKTENGAITFTDVEADSWYEQFVVTAAVKNIVNGISKETFGVGEYITRQDAAVILSRAAEAYYTSFERKQTLVDFTDYDAVSDYAVVAVDTLARAQIINGFEDGSFRPHDYITRAEIAKVIYACIVQ